jgi:hypothetical protein
MKNYYLLLVCLFLFASQQLIHAQVTTSAIEGVVRSATGEVLSGASVKLTHLPTGTVVNSTTSSTGRYFIVNLQPGGPYTIEVSFVGYKAETRSEVYLDLGESAKSDFGLVSTMQELK